MSYRLSFALTVVPLSLLLACGTKVTGGFGASSGTGGSTNSQGSSPTMDAVSASTTGSGFGADTAVGNTTSTSAGVGGAASGPASTSAGVGGTVSAGVGGGGLQCSAPKEAAVWQAMDEAPIALPARAANLDLVGPNKMGLTLLQAEMIDCPCVSLQDAGTGGGGTGGAGAGGCGTGGAGAGGGTGGGAASGCGMGGGPFGPGTDSCAWGDNEEVWLTYDPSTQVGTFMTLWPGYVGTLTAKSRDGAHTYVFPIVSSQIMKDGQSFNLDWNLAGFNTNPAFDAEINELYDALIATYAPGLPADTNCQMSGNCVTGSFGDVAFMFFPQVGAAFWIASLSAGQPVCSTFNRIDLYVP